MTNDKDCHTERYLTTDSADETDFLTTNLQLGVANSTDFFNYELDELNELLAFLAKAPSGWFPKSRQGSPNS